VEALLACHVSTNTYTSTRACTTRVHEHTYTRTPILMCCTKLLTRMQVTNACKMCIDQTQCKQKRIQTHMHTYKHIQAHTNTHAHVQTHTNARAHTHTHAHTFTHTHTHTPHVTFTQTKLCRRTMLAQRFLLHLNAVQLLRSRHGPGMFGVGPSRTNLVVPGVCMDVSLFVYVGVRV
jgi:hypothetical protein